jgi:hypothetical protein
MVSLPPGSPSPSPATTSRALGRGREQTEDALGERLGLDRLGAEAGVLVEREIDACVGRWVARVEEHGKLRVRRADGGERVDTAHAGHGHVEEHE